MPLFVGVEEERLLRAAALMETLAFRGGEAIYRQGDPGDGMYFILSGQVRLSRMEQRGKPPRVLGNLEGGDFFGADTFSPEGMRLDSAIPLGETLVLFLSSEAAPDFSDILPELPERVNLAQETQKLAEAHSFPWIDEAEYIHYASRRHPMMLWLKIGPLVLGGGLLIGMLSAFLPYQQTRWLLLFPSLVILAVLFGLAWVGLDWWNDYYVVTRKRVVVQERTQLLYDTRSESMVDQIQAVETTTSQLGRIFSYGDVSVRTYTGMLVFRAVSNPQEVAAVIRDLQTRSRSGQRQEELRQIDAMLQARLAGTPYEAKEIPNVEAGYHAVEGWLSRLFQLRSEFGDSVQFRTHWFVLLRKLSLPGLLAVASLVAGLWVLARSSAGMLDGVTAGSAFTAACVIFLVMLGWWLYRFLDWYQDVYVITPDMVIDINHKPLGKEDKRSAPMKNILSIEYRRLGILGLLFNYGTVFIRVGESEMTFDEVANPSEVQRELFFRMSQRETREKLAREEQERQRMADWISAYHRLSGSH